MQSTKKQVKRPKLIPLHLASDEQYEKVKAKLRSEIKQTLIDFQKK